MVCYILTRNMKTFNTPASNTSPIDRQSELLLKIKEQGSASISDLAAHFVVSEMTIRRMIHRLADAGLVIRTPGGAMAAPAGSMERTFLERSAKMAGAKEALGRAAAGLVDEGETIVMDSGTTTQCIARYMAGRQNLVVITPSLAVLDELAGSPGVQVRLTGGVYRRSSHDLAGNAVIDALDGVHADKVFFGAAALSFQKGVMNYDAQMPRAFLRAGKQKILVIDSSKVGNEAVYRLCPVESCDLVITDAEVRSSDLSKLKKLTKVLVAE
jgi:DeoR/GlpR family transcriptional regulator of sugar metabolism